MYMNSVHVLVMQLTRNSINIVTNILRLFKTFQEIYKLIFHKQTHRN